MHLPRPLAYRRSSCPTVSSHSGQVYGSVKPGWASILGSAPSVPTTSWVRSSPPRAKARGRPLTQPLHVRTHVLSSRTSPADEPSGAFHAAPFCAITNSGGCRHVRMPVPPCVLLISGPRIL